jgi:1-acyl-sn-glycerol-3-phosphate acyltransferase
MHLPDVGASVPRSGGPIGKALGALTLRALGWRVEGNIPDCPRLVAIVAPHTSNWDFLVGLATRYALQLNASWLGKHTLFRPPFGWFMRRWGGIPVDRSSSHDVVAHTVETFNGRPRVFLVIAPEGTRKKVTRWKTGFWHIAKAAGVPILPVAFDWGTRVVHILPVFLPRASVDEDVAALQSKYDGVRGRTR